jgi:hypothetical protein
VALHIFPLKSLFISSRSTTLKKIPNSIQVKRGCSTSGRTEVHKCKKGPDTGEHTGTCNFSDYAGAERGCLHVIQTCICIHTSIYTLCVYRAFVSRVGRGKNIKKRYCLPAVNSLGAISFRLQLLSKKAAARDKSSAILITVSRLLARLLRINCYALANNE